jgi:mycothiol system anti-sigma-R factor
MTCDEFRVEVPLYLDGELTGSSEQEFLAHLGSCAICSQELESAKEFRLLLQSGRSDEAAPRALRERIERLVHASPDANARVQPLRGPGVRLLRFPMTPLQLGMSIAAGVLVCVGGLLVFKARDHAQSSRFVDAAVAERRGLLDGGMQLDVKSNSSQDVAAWFTPRVPFQFRMPDSGIAAENRAKYQLAGGRLVTFDGERAALLVFQMPSSLISVLIASDHRAHAMGGSVFKSNDILFHTTDRDQTHSVTWDTKGLTYALVSDRAVANEGQCGSCHVGAETVHAHAASTSAWDSVRPMYLKAMPAPQSFRSQVAASQSVASRQDFAMAAQEPRGTR